MITEFRHAGNAKRFDFWRQYDKIPVFHVWGKVSRIVVEEGDLMKRREFLKLGSVAAALSAMRSLGAEAGGPSCDRLCVFHNRFA